MKKRYFLGLVALFLFAFLFGRKREVAVTAVPPAKEGMAHVQKQVREDGGAGASSAPSRAPAAEAGLAAAPLSEDEKKSLASLIGLLAAKDGFQPQSFYDALGKAGLAPVVSRDSNPDTGTLLTVRTGNALPGTRYVHGQMFQAENGAAHLQHLSFEVRPGSGTMETARELLAKAYGGGLGAPLVERDDYVLWRTGPGRVVSVKRLGKDELGDSVFNAHAPEDEGTLWVVAEDEPEHGDGAHVEAR